MIRTASSRRSATRAVEAARRMLLEQIDRAGPVAPARIRAGWPLTGHHVRIVLNDLIRDGLVASDRGGRGRVPRVSLTRAGHEALRNGD